MGGRHTKQRDLLEGSDWLRTVLQHYQKKRLGVSGYESFLIEPATPRVVGGFPPDTVQGPGSKHVIHHGGLIHGYEESCNVTDVFQDGGARLTRVCIKFRNNRDQIQQVDWLVKSAQHGLDTQSTLLSLQHEIKVFSQLLVDIHKYLAGKRNPRSKFLLNIPEYVFQERKLDPDKRLIRCHLVLEDVTKTKNCCPVSPIYTQRGLCLGQFRVFLGTLAQFHAVGLAWKHDLAWGKDGTILDLHPYLESAPGNRLSESEGFRLFSMYERLILWQKKSDPNFDSRLKILILLKEQMSELLAVRVTTDWCDPLGSLCLGPLQPNEVMFQSERPFTNFFEFCTKPNYMPDLHEESNHAGQTSPLCAAVTTGHRIHFGNILRELATTVMTLSESQVRTRYMIFMLQSYCHVLTTTMELLNMDWAKHFQMNFPQFVEKFYELVPQAVLRSIIVHMKLTDPAELTRLISRPPKSGGGMRSPTKKSVNNNIGGNHPTNISDGRNSHQSENVQRSGGGGGREQYIPLTKERIEFLVGLSNKVHKPV